MGSMRPEDMEGRGSFCPHCHAERGLPRSVSIVDGMKTVRYVCPGCEYEWEQTAPDPEALAPHRP
jgi:rubredoxin